MKPSKINSLPIRYLVFGYENYYPRGGWHDFQAAFAELEHAEAYDVKGDYYQIVDLATMKVVKGDIPD